MNGDRCFRAVYTRLPTCFCEKKEIAVREECVDLSMTKTVSV